jgi:hypothetical protein
MTRTIIAALAILIIGGVATAVAQQPVSPLNPFAHLFSGTPQEQAACHPDAVKLCKSVGTDEFRVLGCLQQNRSQISAACRKVLESHGQ